PDADGGMDIMTMEPRPGSQPNRITRRNAPNLGRLEWSPDGSLIAFMQGAEPKYRGYNQDHLFIAAATGGPPRELPPRSGRALLAYAFEGGSRAISIAVEDDRDVYCARIDLAHGSLERASTSEPGVVSAISAAAGHTAILSSSDYEPAELYAL